MSVSGVVGRSNMALNTVIVILHRDLVSGQRLSNRRTLLWHGPTGRHSKNNSEGGPKGRHVALMLYAITAQLALEFQLYPTVWARHRVDTPSR